MQDTVLSVTLGVSHAVEAVAAILIGVALLKVVWLYGRSIFQRNAALAGEHVRVQFGSAVAIALELMLGADVLATAVAPSWDDIGKLAAIAVIRTALNYFLARELKDVKKG